MIIFGFLRGKYEKKISKFFIIFEFIFYYFIYNKIDYKHSESGNLNIFMVFL